MQANHLAEYFLSLPKMLQKDCGLKSKDSINDDGKLHCIIITQQLNWHAWTFLIKL